MVFTLAEVNFIDTNVIAIVRNYKSQVVLDLSVHLTPTKVASDTCSRVISKMSSASKRNMIETINGKQYYVGYIEYDVSDPASGQAIIGWREMETLRTLILGAGKKRPYLSSAYAEVWVFPHCTNVMSCFSPVREHPSPLKYSHGSLFIGYTFKGVERHTSMKFSIFPLRFLDTPITCTYNSSRNAPNGGMVW